MGGGGELFLNKGLAAGVELGYNAPWKAFGSGVGVVSVDGSYHFNRSGNAVPFFTGGYTRTFGPGSANWVNFGAGTDYWFKPNLGLRLEARDHVPTQGNAHMLEFRVGLAFR